MGAINVTFRTADGRELSAEWPDAPEAPRAGDTVSLSDRLLGTRGYLVEQVHRYAVTRREEYAGEHLAYFAVCTVTPAQPSS